MKRPHISRLNIAVWGAARLSQTGWVIEMGVVEALYAVCEPTQINGPFGDGHVDLVFTDPPADFDAEAVCELVAMICDDGS